MINDDEIIKKLNDILVKNPDKLSVLEDQIDISTQMEYFDFSRKIRKDIDEESVLARKDELFGNDISIEDKKELLVQLATIEDVSVFRAIEKFSKLPDEALHDWSIMALNESRMLIESSLLDESQIFISTGLGGKGHKLRYFVVIIAKSPDGLSDIQKQIIKKELDFSLKKNDCELESLEFVDKYTTITTVVPIDIPLQKVFQTAVDECNQMGGFLNENFIVTNVKKLSVEEINSFIDKNNIEEENENISNDIEE